MTRLFLFAVFLLGVPCVSQAFYHDSTLYLGAGMVNHNSGAVATDATSSSKPLLAETYAQLSLTGVFDLGESWGISPDVHYTPVGITESDTGETTSLLTFGIRALYPASNHFDLHLGPGMMLYRISGAGGTIALSNGTGTTTFGRPDSASTSVALYWDAGFGLTYDSFRIDASALVTGVLSSRRTVSPVITLSWGIL